MQRIVITFNTKNATENGKKLFCDDYVEFMKKHNQELKDVIDPVVDFKETDEEIIVNNGHYDYIYLKKEIKKYEFIY